MKLEPGTPVEYRDYKFALRQVTLIKGVVISYKKGRVNTFGDGRISSLPSEEVKPLPSRSEEEILGDLEIAQNSLVRVQQEPSNSWLLPHLQNSVRALQIELSHVR